MKATSLKTAAVIASSIGLLAGSAMAQSTAVSGVVGYETLDFAPGFNFLGLRLHQNPVASGDLEVIGAASVQDTDTDFSSLVATDTYVLEIEDGSGIIVELLGSQGTADGTLTTNTNLLEAGVVDGANYTLRPAATLATIFGDPAGGANNTPLTSSPAPGTADQVWIPDGTGDFNKYYVREFFGAAEWRNAVTDVAVEGGGAAVPVIYTDSVVISAAAAGSVVVSGDLKTAATEMMASSGFNFFGSVYPTGATLASTFGAVADGTNDTDLTASTAPGTADQVWVTAADGSFVKSYINEFFGTAEWRDVDTNTAIDAATVSMTSGYILQAASAKNVVTSAPAFYTDL